MTYPALKDQDSPSNSSPKKSLFPFQLIAIKKMLQFLTSIPTHSVYNACEQGLGKTIMAIIAANELKAQNILIICPAVMRFTWEKELQYWYQIHLSPIEKVAYELMGCERLSVITSSKQFLALKKSKIVIISYDLLSREENLSILRERTWELLIADESHYLNGRSKRTKAVLKHIFPKCQYKIFLSGTPCRSNCIDIFNIAHKILPGIFPTHDSFAERYSYKKMIRIPGGRQIPKYFGIKNAEELSKIIRDNFFIRRTKAEVMPELPEKRFSTIWLGPEYLVEADEKAIAESYLFEAEVKQRGASAPTNFGSLALQRQAQGVKKCPAVVDFVSNLLEQGIPVVLFAWHRKVIALLEAGLSKFSPLVITGDTPAELRHQHVESFQAGKSLVFIGNIVAAGTGITLTKSNTVVFAELSWTPAEIAQAIDRLHRIGTTLPVDIYTLTVKNSLDERINATLVSKAKAIEKLV